MLCGMTATRDNNRSGRVPAGAAVLQVDVTEAIRQGSSPNSPSTLPTFRAMDCAGIEYTIVDITEILRLMRHTDSGE
jgi:hypothetical protein